MIRPLQLALAGMLLAAPALAADLVPPQFQDGDVVCFIGDSITHSRKFHGYIYDYYLTRFPERKIRFVNCGISGDSAGGALQRMDWDILPHQPNVVSIMMGMNDVSRGLYGKTAPDAQNLASRERALTAHRENMAKMAAILDEKRHPKFIFLTPSPYDQTVKVETESLFGVNEALGQCGKYAEELARQYQGGVVDFHAPMTALNLARQKEDPAFTLVGPDRVHPGDVGQMVMAYLYLKAQRLPALVSRFEIDGKSGRVLQSVNGEIRALKTQPDGLTFECRERALPFPVEDAARQALDLVPIETDLNREELAVRLSRAGTYRLAIDGQLVGEYTAAQLGEGINLAFNPQTPQYRQAREVCALNEKRRSLEVRLRSLAQIKIMLLRAKVAEDNDAAINAYFADFLEKMKTAGGQSGYFKSQFDNYTKTRPLVKDIEAEIEQLTQTLWEKNQPRPHQYALTWLHA